MNGNGFRAKTLSLCARVLQRLAAHRAGWRRAPFPFALLCLAAAPLPGVSPSAGGAPPATPGKPVTDTYHGVAVVDDYRWLEDGADPEVRKWSDAQNASARAVLDKLPGVETIRAELTRIMAAPRTSHFDLAVRGEKVFALRRQPPKEQPFLVVLPALDRPDAARVLLDPNDMDKEGATSIDWFVPSPDGSLVAVSVSKGGSEAGDLRVIRAGDGTQAEVVIPRVNAATAGGDLAWAPDGKGFYYTRYPRGDERPADDMNFYQQLYFHQLGTPTAQDRYELGKDLPRIAEVKVEVQQSIGRALCTVQNGDGGEFAHFVRAPGGAWKQFAGFRDGAVQAAFGSGDSLFVVSRNGAPRGKVLRLDATGPDLARATVVVPEGEDSVVTDFYTPPEGATVLPTAGRLYVTYQLGGPSVVRCFAYDGKRLPAPTQPEVGAVGSLTTTGTGEDVIFTAGSFVERASPRLFRAAGGETVKLPLTSPAVVNFSDIEVVREFATSKDGTKVPVSILLPKTAKLDGSNPCLLTGYDGYGVNIEPEFVAARRVLFDRGFVVAVANLRGGGEFGEAWHTGGNLTRKQNVFDDFAAVIRHVIDRRYTSNQKLAIEGGSNGGLLMGATLTQHPDLMKCVVSRVGMYDMLRSELEPNGAFNIPEFGTVADPAQFAALHAYSPYHHVRDGTTYPAILMTTGTNDLRVDPLHSRKMTARLQAANPEGLTLLRTSANSGHGGDTALSERIEEETDAYAFVFWQLGVKVR